LSLFIGGIFIILIIRLVLLYKVENDKFPELFNPFSGDQMWILENLFFPSVFPKLRGMENGKVIKMLNALRIIYWIVWLQFLIAVCFGEIYGYS